MEIKLIDVLKMIRRFRNESQYGRALFMLEMTFHIEGGKAAVRHARRIVAAYNNVRVSREMEMSL